MNFADSDEELTENVRNLYFFLMLFFSIPISYTTFYVIPKELPQLISTANIGTYIFMIPFLVRIRSGWGTTAQKLRKKSIYYEAQQTGLFKRKSGLDRQRDRLAAKTQIAPVLARLDTEIFNVLWSVVLWITALEGVTIWEGESGPWWGPDFPCINFT